MIRPAAARQPSCVLELIAIALAGVNLRAALACLPALTAQIRRDTGLTLAEIGVLTALPVLCLGVAAPLATRLTGRLGTERTVAAGLATLAVGLAARHWSATPTVLYTSTLVAGLGIAIVGAALPGLVRERFAHRVGSVTGLYTTAMTLGASLAAGLAVPAEALLGSWHDALAVWALPAAAGTVAWLTLDRTRRRREPRPPSAPRSVAAPHLPRLPWRDRTAWMITAYQSTQSVLAFSELAWIGPSYTDLGQTPRTAGLLVATYTAAGVIAALALPLLADRLPFRPLLRTALACAFAGTGLLALTPSFASWAIVALLGFGQTAGFALGLVLLAAVTTGSDTAQGLTAMAFLVAYPVAAVAPPVLGAVRDATGSFAVVFLTLAAINGAALILGHHLPTDVRRTAQPAAV